MKVMLFCPTYRIEPETLDSLFRLDVGEHFVHMLFTRGNHTVTVGKVNTLLAYQAGRKAFLAGDYDAMLIVESDMIVPPDTLHKLIALDCDMAFGLYVHRHGFPWLNAHRRREDDPTKQGFFYKTDEIADIWGQQIDVSGGGFGCLLVKRHVLEDMNFRVDWLVHPNKKTVVWIPADCDAYFMADALDKGYSMRMDTSVACGHKEPDGNILWPTSAGVVKENHPPTPYPII